MDSWKNLNYQLVISKLEQMSRYLDSMNSAIKDNLRQVEADIEAITKSMNEEEKSEFYDFHENDVIEVSGDFTNLLFSSFVISWYSFIEHELISICKVLDLRISISIKDDTRHYGEGIQRAYRFLEKSEKYKIDNGHWQELKNIQKIRNRLVHEGSILIPKPTKTKSSIEIDLGENSFVYLPIDDELYRYLTQHDLYYVGQLAVMPHYTYCKHLVKLGADLLTQIYKDFGLNT